MELNKEQLVSLNKIIAHHLYEYEITEVIFKDSCGCYSEYTTEWCSLTVSIKTNLLALERDNLDVCIMLEDDIKEWGELSLIFNSCECCDGNLYVDVRLFDKDKK